MNHYSNSFILLEWGGWLLDGLMGMGKERYDKGAKPHTCGATCAATDHRKLLSECDWSHCATAAPFTLEEECVGCVSKSPCVPANTFWCC